MRLLIFVFFLASCAYEGPRIESLVPADRDQTLKSSVIDAKRFDNLLVYGDSLSDPGNLSDNSLHIVLPHEIFYKGRFSNGPVWADYVEKSTGWKVYNYAVAGARTHEGSFPDRLLVTDFPQQITKSRDRLKTLDPERTLIAIWIGPNNFLRNGGEFEDKKGVTEKAKLQKGVASGIAEIKEEIEKLILSGFLHFEMGTMPELGGINRSPRSGRTASDATLFEATRLHNQALLGLIEELKGRYPALQMATFHAYDINKATYERPKDYGFTVLGKPCFEGSVTGEFYGEKRFCPDLLGYKFWEYLHPNTLMHCYYASQFLKDAEDAKFLEVKPKDEPIRQCLGMKAKGEKS